MLQIYSNVHADRLLHIVFELGDIKASRTDLSPSDQFLQVSLLSADSGKKFKPHKHIWKKPSYTHTIAQESWCVIQGSVQVYYYDIDDKLIHTAVLNQGDCSITFEGGHSYNILEDNSVIYEFKTGPYLGQENDKVFID